ncbi:hypothetical protein TNCV_2142551 [Trichonephila clavipes]|nr:hypothetical protein TNCV_2142551 [Trichonephila clavipes]
MKLLFRIPFTPNDSDSFVIIYLIDEDSASSFPAQISRDSFPAFTTNEFGYIRHEFRPHVIQQEGFWRALSSDVELAPPLLTTTPHQREDEALDSDCPTRRVFSGTWIELMTVVTRYLERCKLAEKRRFKQQ